MGPIVMQIGKQIITKVVIPLAVEVIAKKIVDGRKK